MTIFSDELLSCLPDRVQAKLRRIESSPPDDSTAALLRRAVRYLESHGASYRYAEHDIRPAHVVPVVNLPTHGHADAVAALRQRLRDLDAATAEAAAKLRTTDPASAVGVAAAELRLTDLGLARLALERIEESVIEAAADHGVTIARRPDIDPAAFLEIERA